MEDRYLSVEDIKKIADKPFNVVKFGDLKHYKDIDEVFKPKFMGMEYFSVNDVLILYEMKENSGHWCVLKRSIPKGFSEYYRYDFLDSYGEIIDSQRHHINSKFRDKSGQNTPNILNKLFEAQNGLNKSGVKDIHYNDKVLQKPGYSTCGRYAGLFIRFDTTVENFAKQLKTLAKKKKIPIDDLVINLTAKYLEK